MTRSLAGRVASLLLVALALVLPAPAAAKVKPVYMVGLGDSLSRGVQDNGQGTSILTDRGYNDVLYAQLRKRIPNLKLVKLGCPGESTTSYLTGKGNVVNIDCKPKGGSQRKEAEAFLNARRRAGDLALVTLDIGNNDLSGCAKGGQIDYTCLGTGFGQIEKNLPVIVKGLRKAAGKTAPIAGATFYDPFLALYLDPSTRGVALASASLAKDVNTKVAAALTAGKLRIARIDEAFETYKTDSTTTYNGQEVPVAVRRVCELTWMCAQGNIHANDAGYKLMATTFRKALGSFSVPVPR